MTDAIRHPSRPHHCKGALIELRNVSVDFGRTVVLPDVSLCVDRGDFMAITGPNGGGKTTLLRTMLKLIKPTCGTVNYFTCEGLPTKKLKIGYLPQKNNIDTRFPITVCEAVRTGLLTGFFGRPDKSDMQRFGQVVELTGIGAYLDRPIGALSGGQLQRTLLARALVGNPEVLVLDEPLSYVDKTFERQIYDMMAELAKEVTIVLVSHEMSVIATMANRHIIVDRGLHECSHTTHNLPPECD